MGMIDTLAQANRAERQNFNEGVQGLWDVGRKQKVAGILQKLITDLGTDAGPEELQQWMGQNNLDYDTMTSVLPVYKMYKDSFAPKEKWGERETGDQGETFQRNLGTNKIQPLLGRPTKAKNKTVGLYKVGKGLDVPGLDTSSLEPGTGLTVTFEDGVPVAVKTAEPKKPKLQIITTTDNAGNEIQKAVKVEEGAVYPKIKKPALNQAQIMARLTTLGQVEQKLDTTGGLDSMSFAALSQLYPEMAKKAQNQDKTALKAEINRERNYLKRLLPEKSKDPLNLFTE